MKGKRNIKIADETESTIDVCVWAPAAHQFDSLPVEFPVIAFKCARIVEFMGKALTLSEDASFEFEPKEERATELRTWYNGVDKTNLKSVNA
jgi:hypothetical protein